VDVHKRLVEIEREALHLGLFEFSPRELRRLENREAWIAQAAPRKEPRIPKHKRPRCGAKTRKGTPCKAPAVSGSNRCRLHGGLSTGPRTEEGRAAIAESTRRRAVLADLVELAELEEGQAKRWAAAVVELAKGRGLRPAGRAAGVSHETVRRWRQSPSFLEAERRARARWERRSRKAKPSRRPGWSHPKGRKNTAAELRAAIAVLDHVLGWP